MNKAQSTMDQGTKKSNAVAEKVAAGALAVSLFEADADKGLANLGHEDLALPFLKILGQLSPEVNKRDGKYVQGAEPGMIYNSVTGELFDGSGFKASIFFEVPQETFNNIPKNKVKTANKVFISN